MINSQTITYVALLDLLFILFSYLTVKAAIKFLFNKDSQEETSPFWLKVESFIKRFHIMKVVYLIALFIIIRLDILVIADSITSDIKPLEILQKINVLLVGNVMALMFWIQTSKVEG